MPHVVIAPLLANCQLIGRRLPHIAGSGELVAFEWRLVSRTDDDLTLVFTVNRSRQRIRDILGVSVHESETSVSVAILGWVVSGQADQAGHSLVAQSIVDLPNRLAGRPVVNPLKG